MSSSYPRRQVLPEPALERRRVAAVHQRVDEHWEVVPGLGAFGRGHVFVGIAGRPNSGVMDGQPDGQAGVYCLQGMKAGDMGADLVVDGMASLENVAHPGGMIAHQVAFVRHDKGLVESHPELDPVAQGIADYGGILTEPVRYIGVRPAAAPEQGGGEVPMEKGDERLYPGGSRRLSTRRS